VARGWNDLEDAGYRVVVPAARLCCGRPLYDYGMLGLAKRKLRQVIDVLRPAIRAGVPVIGLEPSCVSVFRDELTNLMPDDRDAYRLAKQTMMLSEFLMKDRQWQPARLERTAPAHAHCHHRSVLDLEAQQRMFAAMGLKVEYPKVGCCGQAGSFGYEAEHYDVSMRIGEQGLLPAVRKASLGHAHHCRWFQLPRADLAWRATLGGASGGSSGSRNPVQAAHSG
jgi:Fe-S oxidoreductase